MYQACEAMNTEVITISADVIVEEAIRSLIENQISGMPVVDEKEHLVGIVSEFQLLKVLICPEIKEKPVRDVMTKDVLTVSPNTLLSDATSMMVMHRIRRLPVTDNDNGKIVGLIARRDLLRYALEAGNELDDFLDEIKACIVSRRDLLGYSFEAGHELGDFFEEIKPSVGSSSCV